MEVDGIDCCDQEARNNEGTVCIFPVSCYTLKERN